MRPDSQPSTPNSRKRGATLVLVAVSVVALFGFSALVVDLGYVLVTRTQLQNAADATSLAATRLLGSMYQELTPAEQQLFSCSGDCAEEIQDTARAVAANNRAGGAAVLLDPLDIRIGQWDGNAFSPTPDEPDAVEVTARRDESANGTITTFFARALGIDEVSVTAIATAALTGQGSAGEGDILFPVSLSSWFFAGDADRCNDYIRFNPSNDPASCGGWTTWDLNSNTPNLRKILDGDHESPAINAYETFINMTGGNLATTFNNLLTLFQWQGCATDDSDARNYLTNGDDTCIDWQEAITHPEAVPWLEEGVQAYWYDPKPPHKEDLSAPRFYHKWETVVPVYDRDDCSNPNQSIKVVGFAPVIITDVTGPSLKQIDGKVICKLVSPEPNRGGGGNFGIKGSIPGLVR